jgi:hypothetical protein
VKPRVLVLRTTTLVAGISSLMTLLAEVVATTSCLSTTAGCSVGAATTRWLEDVVLISVTVVCSGFGASLSCNPRGFGRGIDVPNRSGTVVTNGEVQGMGIGLVLGTRGTILEGANRVEKVTVRNSFESGMSIQGGIVTGCIANSNGGGGIFMSGGTVVNNVAVGNNGAGIAVGDTGTVLDNSASFNGTTGLELGSPRVGYGNNVLSGNNTDVIGGTQIRTNLCTETVCP